MMKTCLNGSLYKLLPTKDNLKEQQHEYSSGKRKQPEYK